MRSEYLLCLLILAVVLAYDCGRCAAKAQPDDRTALVRMWVGEARWTAHRDHSAQAHIMARWARRYSLPLSKAIELRVTRWSRPPRWISRIEPTCQQPHGWPARLSWGRHYDDCWALYAAADAFLRGAVADPCGGRARGWRAPGPAFLQALELGRRPVWCGRTHNKFVR